MNKYEELIIINGTLHDNDKLNDKRFRKALDVLTEKPQKTSYYSSSLNILGGALFVASGLVLLQKYKRN
jgi:hypothetical protein